VTANFPQDCSICHNTSAWTPASFNHALTRFPLTGAHISVACTSCHSNGVYAGTPTDCYSCHSREYTTTTDPNHVAAGFPRDCSTCHSTAAWTGATFTHAQFPIYSGTHAGRWSSCGDCHTNSSNYAVFSCTTSCHDKTATDSNHRGVSGYVYNSANCYSCHPSGRAG
jgi:nitrate/TMAO reductase-like tetraheme cytochrome c subunit